MTTPVQALFDLSGRVALVTGGSRGLGLQIAEALVALGFGKDLRLANTLELIRSKQDEEGRWPLEYNYDGKTWMRFGKMKEPNPWVTLRASMTLRPDCSACSMLMRALRTCPTGNSCPPSAKRARRRTA